MPNVETRRRSMTQMSNALGSFGGKIARIGPFGLIGFSNNVDGPVYPSFSPHIQILKHFPTGLAIFNKHFLGSPDPFLPIFNYER
jgi:hypothetical protein